MIKTSEDKNKLNSSSNNLLDKNDELKIPETNQMQTDKIL